MTMDIQTPLTLEVNQHPNVAEREGEGLSTYITGSIKVKGDFDVRRNLHNGERVMVTITDEDGAVLDRRYCTISPPQFENIVEKHAGVIGVNRAHVASVSEEVG